MIPAKGYAATSPESPLAPWSFERRDVGPHDVRFDISHCGVCHSDLHMARNEWGVSVYPVVPGHELVGHVVEVGAHVTKFKVGDRVGVGCLVDSCQQCENCAQDLEQHCLNGATQTYNSPEAATGQSFAFVAQTTAPTGACSGNASAGDGLVLALLQSY
jgi:uncharacterized zinc-type alcohol dehydrogenase-like protein